MNNFTSSSSVISSDTVIKGKIDFKGELLIEGKTSGDILGDSLTLGPSAKVDGKIIVKAITVQGSFTGFIRSDAVKLDWVRLSMEISNTVKFLLRQVLTLMAR